MKNKTFYVCDECGYESAKWLGRCTACGEWDSMKQFNAEAKSPRNAKSRTGGNVSGSAYNAYNAPKKLQDIQWQEQQRVRTNINELDRVLGGGIVKGSLVLVGGDPGIGKSTLLLQLCNTLDCRGADAVLYVSGEESENQIKMRAERLGVDNESLLLFSETDMSRILNAVRETHPAVVIVDSIQTMRNDEIQSLPGSVTQVRESTQALMRIAKESGTSVMIVGHVTKEGAFAGPKILEHMVDCVLYFEGERHQFHRILRAVKNRYGSTNEIGVFEMREEGLKEVENPSIMLLEGRLSGAPGSCVVCSMEGTRPMLAEVQALATRTSFPSPRRTSTGIDYNRVLMLLAVLEKRVGQNMSMHDAYVNVAGGLRIDEPGADLGAALALASSFADKPLPDNLAAIGEVGLTGEIRAVNSIEKRVNEAAKLGFDVIAIPKGSKISDVPENVKLLYVDTLARAVGVLM